MLRINKHLPSYALEASGTAILRETGEVIEPINKTETRLTSVETVFLETKNKVINIVRRFTTDQLIRLYNEGVDITEVSEKPEKTKPQTRTDVSKKGFAKNETATIVVNDKKYSSLRQASEDLQISKDVISKRIKSDEYPNYYKIE